MVCCPTRKEFGGSSFLHSNKLGFLAFGLALREISLNTNYLSAEPLLLQRHTKSIVNKLVKHPLLPPQSFLIPTETPGNLPVRC